MRATASRSRSNESTTAVVVKTIYATAVHNISRGAKQRRLLNTSSGGEKGGAQSIRKQGVALPILLYVASFSHSIRLFRGPVKTSCRTSRNNSEMPYTLRTCSIRYRHRLQSRSWGSACGFQQFLIRVSTDPEPRIRRCFYTRDECRSSVHVLRRPLTHRRSSRNRKIMLF